MRTVDVQERRSRLAVRHHLAGATRADTVAQAAGSLVALHSTDPVTVFLSARARVEGADVAVIERELYETRTLVRMLGMRRTLFVAPREARPVIQAACTDAIAVRERTRLLQWIETSDVARDASRWLADIEQLALAEVGRRGEVATAELTTGVEELGTQIRIGQGRWAASVPIATRVLPLLAAQGLLVRTRPRGRWISGQYRWALIERWLDAPEPAIDVADARAELVRGWLRGFGPGTLGDLRWWTGLGAGEIGKALSAVAAVEVDLGGISGFLLPDDVEPVATPEPWVALLPSLDTTTMGWFERDWYLGEYRDRLFDGNGNAGPTVWCDGRIVGGWTQRPDGEIVTLVLEDVGTDARTVIDAEAQRLGGWLGSVRVTPRFPTPVQRDLSA